MKILKILFISIIGASVTLGNALEEQSAKATFKNISKAFEEDRVKDALALMTENGKEKWAVKLIDGAQACLRESRIEQPKGQDFATLSKVIDLEQISIDIESANTKPDKWKGVLRRAAWIVSDDKEALGALYRFCRQLGVDTIFPQEAEEAPEGFESEHLVWAYHTLPEPAESLIGTWGLTPLQTFDLYLSSHAQYALMAPPRALHFVKYKEGWRYDGAPSYDGMMSEEFYGKVVDTLFDGIDPAKRKMPSEKEIEAKVLEYKKRIEAKKKR